MDIDRSTLKRRGRRNVAARAAHTHLVISMFQNTGTGAIRKPLTFLRIATGWYYSPTGISGVTSMPRNCTASAIAFCLAGSVSRAKSSRSFSSLRVARPAEQRLVAGRVQIGGRDRVHHVGGDPGGQEGVPAAGVGRVLLGAARDQRLPIHRLHVDLEAGLLHQRFRHRRQVGQHLQVGRVHQHDRRAVVAGFLQQLLRLLGSWR